MRERPSQSMPWVKVCGLKSHEDVEACIDAGATHIGLNLYEPSPRSIELELAIELRARSRGRISVVVLGVEPSVSTLLSWEDRIAPDWFQLHGDLQASNLDVLRTPFFRARGLKDAQDLRSASDLADPFLLIDAKDDNVHGGTGRLAPTELARELCAARTCVLAGGLDPDNVTQQVERVRPAGVDVASGVEQVRGQKSTALIASFCSAAHAALQSIRKGA